MRRPLTVAPGRILVEPVKIEEAESSIVAPQTARSEPATIGRILEVAEDLDWLPVAGDGTTYCVFRPYAGVEAEVAGKTYRILTPESIDGFFSWRPVSGGTPQAGPS